MRFPWFLPSKALRLSPSLRIPLHLSHHSCVVCYQNLTSLRTIGNKLSADQRMPVPLVKGNSRGGSLAFDTQPNQDLGNLKGKRSRSCPDPAFHTVNTGAVFLNHRLTVNTGILSDVIFLINLLGWYFALGLNSCGGLIIFCRCGRLLSLTDFKGLKNVLFNNRSAQ